MLRLGNRLFFFLKKKNKPPLFSAHFWPRERNGKEIEEIIQLIKIMLNSMCINVNGEKE